MSQKDHKSEAQQVKNARSLYPYTPQQCQANSGHLVTSRTVGPAVHGGPVCLRCGIEAPPGSARVAAGVTISDPLSLLNNRTA